MVTLLTVVLLLLLLLYLLLMVVASLLLLLLTTPPTPAHSHTLTWWLAISIGHICSASPVVPLVLVSPIPVPRLVLLFFVIFGQELPLWVWDREVSKDIGGRVGLLLEVPVCHGSLTGEPLGGVHDQQFLQELESLRVWFDPVPVHVLQQGAVHIRGALEVLKKKFNFPFQSISNYLTNLQQCWVLWHPPHVFPILLLQSAHAGIVTICHFHLGEAHHVEDPVKLVVVIWVACLDILLPVYLNM